MDASFWRERWGADQIGFHEHQVHPDLQRFAEDWLEGASGVLVPLCGKTVDLPWLARRVPTVGVELVHKAVEALHDEHGLSADCEPSGSFVAWRTENLTVLCGDVFELRPHHVAQVNRVWDRAALVALDPPRRRRYAETLRNALQPGAQILLSAFAYDQQRMSGPPHSVPEDEVRSLYDGADIEVLLEDRELDPRWKQRGHDWWVRTVYRVTL